MFNELKRRNVIRVAFGYIVSCWLLAQVADLVLENIGAPAWVMQTILLLMALGFPVVVFFSWAYEVTPEGIKLESEIDRSQSITQVTGSKLDRAITIVLAIALAYFIYDKFILSNQRDTALIEAATQAMTEQVIAESKVAAQLTKSIAVLPFVNMSSDEEQEYFSDGLSEELLNLLVKIPELRVTSRSSAFSYKGKDFKIADVGRELKVAYVLEGSVRKSGKQVRITAQLIQVDTDTHLWSQTYDRSLDNIFSIQDEIASAVVTKLKLTLLGEAPVVRETDPQAYALYLQSRHLRLQRTAEAFDEAITLLQQALAIDPDYAAAWVQLGAVYTSQADIGLRPIDEGYTLAREAMYKALAIDPDSATAHAGLGFIALAYDNNLDAAARHLERALQLEPANTDIIRRAASLTTSLGRLDEAIALAEFVVSRDPVNPAGLSNLGLYYASAGHWDEAISSYRTALQLSPGLSGARNNIGQALMLKGEPQAALESIQLEDSIWRMIGLPMAYHALGRTFESDAALAELIDQYAEDAAYNIAYVLAYRGESDRAFEWLDKAVQLQDPGLPEILRERLFSDLHDDPRWLPFLERIGYSPGQLAAIEFKVTLPD